MIFAVCEHLTNLYAQGESSREATVRNFQIVKLEFLIGENFKLI